MTHRVRESVSDGEVVRWTHVRPAGSGPPILFHLSGMAVLGILNGSHRRLNRLKRNIN